MSRCSGRGAADAWSRPSAVVEYQGLAYSLGTVIDKLQREGALSVGASALPRDVREHPDRYPVATSEATGGEGPCVCCGSSNSIWGPGDWWPWDYTMGACLCVLCRFRLNAAGVRSLPCEARHGGIWTIKSGVRVAPDPNECAEYGEIVLSIGRSVSPEEVCWANQGASQAYSKPLGDLIEDLRRAGRTLMRAEFEQLIRRGSAP